VFGALVSCPPAPPGLYFLERLAGEQVEVVIRAMVGPRLRSRWNEPGPPSGFSHVHAQQWVMAPHPERAKFSWRSRSRAPVVSS
jgi:hypothetical protein